MNRNVRKRTVGDSHQPAHPPDTLNYGYPKNAPSEDSDQTARMRSLI